jgi:hypothetical protein
MTTLADRIVAVCTAEIGVAEVPLGSNTGPRVLEYQASTSYAKTQRTGWPWCDAFYKWVQDQAAPGKPNAGSASTAVSCQIARQNGWLTTTPKVGCGIIWCGTHVGIVVGIGDGVVYTIEGNSGDKVTPHTRAIAGAQFIVPDWLDEVVKPPRLYWIYDPGASYVIRGPWAKLKSAEKQKACLKEALQRRATVLRTGDGKYVLRIGEPPRRGPFLDPAKRDDVLERLEKTLGRKLVPRSTVSKENPATAAPLPAGSAEGLGKTT